MNIGFAIDPVGPGGTRTWIKFFSDYCIQKGHQVYFSPADELDNIPLDIYLSLAYYTPLEILKSYRERGIKIVYRMDGIYFPFFIKDQHTMMQFNEIIKENLHFADKIIFQSQFSKEMALQLDHTILDQNKQYSIINNGADPKVFTAQGPIINRSKDKTVILAIAYWGTETMAEYSLRHLTEVAMQLQHRGDIEFWILGQAYPHIENYIKQYNLPNITQLNLSDPITRADMPKYIRSADLVVHIRPNDACSNLIIETMTLGKPIVGLNLGSTPELVGDSALLADCIPSWTSAPTINTQHMTEQILTTLRDIEHYSHLIKERGKLFSLDKMCEHYLESFASLLQK